MAYHRGFAYGSPKNNLAAVKPLSILLGFEVTALKKDYLVRHTRSLPYAQIMSNLNIH